MVKFHHLASLLLVAGAASSARAFSPTLGAAASRGMGITTTRMAASSQTSLPVVCGEDVMSQKAHGTTEKPVMKDLRWGCDYETADRICCFNRHYAEYAGYWQTVRSFLEEASKGEPIDFYDSVTGEKLFTAPVGRTMEQFLAESQSHGWPSFRDEETNWDYVRCLENGECVSTAGTHLGHNIPDSSGNRYCINLVSVAGQPSE